MLETKTGAQVVAAIVARSDSYPEAPWKAFALGAAAVALLAVAFPLVARDWETGRPALYNAVAILGSGAVLALLTAVFAPLARMFTDPPRRRLEVGQHARLMFSDRGLDRTRGHIGILLLVSLFERQVVLLADDGFEGRIDDSDWQELTQRVTLLLRHDSAIGAFQAGLDGLEALLLARGFRGDGEASESANAIAEKGGRP